MCLVMMKNMKLVSEMLLNNKNEQKIKEGKWVLLESI